MFHKVIAHAHKKWDRGCWERGAAEGVWIQGGGSDREVKKIRYININNFYLSSIIITVN
jgi:hypothetical protein